MILSPDLFRIGITLPILVYSCVTDLRYRRAPNWLWYVLGSAGLAIDLGEFALRGFDAVYVLWLAASVALVSALAYGIYRARGFGGADAKALMALAIVYPLYPMPEVCGLALPIGTGMLPPVFAFSVLGNALVLNLVPLGITLFRNLTTVPLAELLACPVAALAGWKAEIGRIDGRYVQLLHRYKEDSDGTVKLQVAYRGQDANPETVDRLARWQKEGKIRDMVWVTPRLPFLLPLTAGFVAAVACGDLLFLIVSSLT